MSVPATKSLWRVLAISFAVIFAYATVLVKLANDWWVDENYSHGLLIPFVIGYILWLQRDKLTNADSRPTWAWGGLADWRSAHGALGRCCWSGVIHTTVIAAADSDRHYAVLLWLAAVAVVVCSPRIAFLGASDSHNRLQSYCFSTSTVRIALCSLVDERSWNSGTAAGKCY